jgi:two-component system chemotaxis response regulator CheY
MIELKKLIGNYNRFRILIVDDKTNMRRTIRNMLRHLGFTNLDEAEDGDVALRKILADQFDFVICDWNMPRMSGLEVLRALRKQDKYRSLPFLMITAEVEEGTVAESIEAQVDGYILKPFVPRTLEDKMVDILKRKLNPSDLDTHLRLADAYFHAGEYDKTHIELDEAAKISPRNPKLHFTRGLAYEAQGNFQEAESAFQMSRKTGPKFVRAREKLAEIYSRQGKTSEMLSVLKEAVRVSPKNPDRQMALGTGLVGGRPHSGSAQGLSGGYGHGAGKHGPHYSRW